MSVFLVRHAKAGSRHNWEGPDDLRPLSEPGRRQTRTITDRLVHEEVTRVMSSPFVRCVQTVEPLAHKLGLPVEDDLRLDEAADLDETWALLESLAQAHAVLCSHGNIIPPVLDRLHRRGVPLVATEMSCKKGSIWALEIDPSGGFLRAELILPAG